MNGLQEVKKLSQEIEEKYRAMFDILMKEYPNGNPIVECDEIYDELSASDRDQLNNLYREYRERKYREAVFYMDTISSNYELNFGQRRDGDYYFGFWLTDTEQSFEVRV